MVTQILKRDGLDLVVHWPSLSEQLTDAQLQSKPEAGSHPHKVRGFLLACSLFPEKWLNRVFSVGGIRWQGEHLHLLTYKSIDPYQDEVYTSARQIGARAAKILYEDEHCLVVYKPVGMPVHGSYKGQIETLDVAVAKHMLQKADPIEVRHIHRLDDDTSGPVLYSKHDLAQQRLDEAMRVKNIERLYIAIVEGVMRKDKGTIDAPIGKDRNQPKARRVSPTGDHAVTHYKVLQRFHRHTLVDVQLETGRTHQIRVHMSHIHHPIVGDSLYGGSTDMIKTQALHGHTLIFPHPITKQSLTVEAPLPRWFVQLKEQIAKS